jgi:enterochelin esterase-like enzyme
MIFAMLKRATFTRLWAKSIIGLSMALLLSGCGLLFGSADTSPSQPSTPTGTQLFQPGPPTDTPLPSPTPTPCPNDYQLDQVQSYPSSILDLDIPLLVYLPPCYDATITYPLVFMLHGSPMDENQWVELGAIDLLNHGYHTMGWTPAIIVIPYLPEPLFTQSDGGPNSYEDELVNSLVPFIKTHYAVSADHAAIAGISRGGVWAIEIALTHPELFSIVGAISPALHVNNPRPEYDPYLLVDNNPNLPAYFVMSAGDNEPGFSNATHRLAQALTVAGRPTEVYVVAGNHVPENWEAGLALVLADIMAALGK